MRIDLNSIKNGNKGSGNTLDPGEFRYDAEPVAGDFDFQFTWIEEKTSSKGNPMTVLTLNVKGANLKVKEHITEKTFFKVERVLKAFDPEQFKDMQHAIESGDTGFEVNMRSLKGLRGRVRLKIEPGRNGYGPKAVVADFLTEVPVPATTEVDELGF